MILKALTNFNELNPKPYRSFNTKMHPNLVKNWLFNIWDIVLKYNDIHLIHFFYIQKKKKKISVFICGVLKQSGWPKWTSLLCFGLIHIQTAPVGPGPHKHRERLYYMLWLQAFSHRVIVSWPVTMLCSSLIISGCFSLLSLCRSLSSSVQFWQRALVGFYKLWSGVHLFSQADTGCICACIFAL